MQSINIYAWGKPVATIIQEGNSIAIDGIGEELKLFSPLKFEHNQQAEAILSRDEDISSIGIIADALPGQYGRSYLDRYFLDEFGKKPSLIERLAFIGSHGLGALEFIPPDNRGDINTRKYASLEALRLESRIENKGEHKLEIPKLVAISNSAAGGARSKAVVSYNPQTQGIHIAQKQTENPKGYKKCIVKFNTEKSSDAIENLNQEIRAEYLYTKLADACGIYMSNSWLAHEAGRDYFITERFDVQDERLHMHSLAGIFGHNSASFEMDYASLFRAGNMLAIPHNDQEQAFRVMLFNLVFSNRDDHNRNFSFLMDKEGSWRFAPAYDLTFSQHAYGTHWHQMTIGNKPTHTVRESGLRKIAKVCGVDEPIKMIREMIQIKHDVMSELQKEYDLNGLYEKVAAITAEIDKRYM